MLRLPSVTLDTTLADLYRRGDNSDRIGLVMCAANSELSMNSNIPRNKKFLYQDNTFSTTPENLASDDYEELRRYVAVKYLSLVPQHDAFAAGNMTVILFNLNSSEEQLICSQKEAEETINSLDPSQKPQLHFYQDPASINLEKLGIDLLASKMELDNLESFPMTVDLETHYFLNSKAGLATSGLPTPACELVELDSYSIDAQSCCSVCSSKASSLHIPEDCKGSRGQWLSSQISRIISQISTRSLPFVLKNQQTFGGGGTYVVSTEDERQTLNHNLSTRLLPKLLSQVTSTNFHLQPATLLLSELISNPTGDYGLTFFVTKAGKCVFLAVTEQKVDDSKAWIGSKILYPMQEQLKQKFNTIMHQIGAWLYSHGYYGPIGADILETAPKGGKSTSSDLQVVDLNVRTSGSLSLGLLGGHFSKQRGLLQATSFSVNLKMGRQDFIEMLPSQFQEGRVVIVSWYMDPESKISFANLVIGGENSDRLEKEIKRVKQYSTEIHF